MKRIRVTYEIIDEESVGYGVIKDGGWIDEEGIDFTPDEFDREEGLTAVDLAIRYLRDEGAVDISSSHPARGDWFTYFGDMNCKNGEYENRSFHPVDEDWTDEELDKMFKGVTTQQSSKYQSE